MTAQVTGASGVIASAPERILRSANLRDVAVAATLGLGLVWLAGFANANALHGATHDTRHATGFPCH